MLDELAQREIIDTGVIVSPDARFYPVSLDRFIREILDQEFRDVASRRVSASGSTGFTSVGVEARLLGAAPVLRLAVAGERDQARAAAPASARRRRATS